VHNALRTAGGTAALSKLYELIEKQYPEAKRRAHWKAKIRQVVQLDPGIRKVEVGVWAVTENRKDEDRT